MEPASNFPQRDLNMGAVREGRIEFKGISPEPEVEECCEDVQLRDVIERIGVDFDAIANVNCIAHGTDRNTCVHCKLLVKISSLQEGIEKMTQELEVAQEMLKVKKTQNQDIKHIVETLQETINTKANNLEPSLDATGSHCSCSRSCNII